jgi:predicted Na+-dependent transporter
MQFGTATPVFFAIVAMVLFALVAAATGANVISVFFVALLTSYVLFIASVGGFANADAFGMAAGVGVLVMIPTAVGLVVAIFIGWVVHGIRRKDRTTPEE